MSTPAPMQPRKLAIATIVAMAIAALVLIVAVLPAEYGLDLTGLGRATGFTKLNEEVPPTTVTEPAEEEGPRPLYRLRTDWRLDSFPISRHDGYSSRSKTEERVAIPIGVTNLTSLTARLEWNDTDLIDGRLTEGDLFELSIRAPDGRRSQLIQTKNEPGLAANITLTFSVASVPFPQENASAGISISTAEDTTGVGNWTFVIRLYSAGSLNGSEAKDPGNNWTLSVEGEAYALEVDKQADRAGDRVRITLNPNQGLEYKFIMKPGATLHYEWESTAPVYWDFHAEEEGKPREEFTRFEEGTSDGEEGTRKATFAGRHGWYWLNKGTTPVTITLETTGDYEILGVPA